MTRLIARAPLYHLLLKVEPDCGVTFLQYKGGAFKVPELFRWHVVVTGHKLIEDLRKASPDELSFNEASAEVCLALNPIIHHCRPADPPYCNSFLRSTSRWDQRFTRILTMSPLLRTNSLGISVHYFLRLRMNFKWLLMTLSLLLTVCLDLHSKLIVYSRPGSFSEWIKVPALNTVMQIICRVSNRVFVGLPKCMAFFNITLRCHFTHVELFSGRDLDYRALNIEFTVGVMKGAFVINMFPKLLRPYVCYIFPSSLRLMTCPLR